MVLALFNYEPLTYHNGKYPYPVWAHIIGWGITIGSLLCVPAYAVFNIYRAEGSSFGAVREKL